MIEVDVPSFGKLTLEHLVLDYNGTLAVDGEPLPGVRESLAALAGRLTVHVVTGDTFGKVRQEMAGFPCELVVLEAEGQARAKLAYIENLSAESVAAIGNGRNDRLMLERAALGIAVTEGEGTSVEALRAADVACRGILDALGLLLNPRRLVATLRG